MNGLSLPIDADPDSAEPLKIEVTDAGRSAVLLSLVDQCVPVLRNPDRITPKRRLDLAERLERAILPQGYNRVEDTPAAAPDWCKGRAVSIQRYKERYWAVFDTDGSLICVTVYRKGAEEVKRRLSATAS